MQRILAKRSESKNRFQPVSNPPLKTALVLNLASQQNTRFVGQLAASVANFHLSKEIVKGKGLLSRGRKLYLAAVSETIQ